MNEPVDDSWISEIEAYANDAEDLGGLEVDLGGGESALWFALALTGAVMAFGVSLLLLIQKFVSRRQCRECKRQRERRKAKAS